MRVCKECGTENDENIVFCKWCGAKLIKDAKYKPRLTLKGDNKTFVLNNGGHIGANDKSNLNKYLSIFPNISKDFCVVSEENGKWFIENISNNNWFLFNEEVILSGQKIELENLSTISFAIVSFICEFVEDEYILEEKHYIPCPFGKIELKFKNESSEKCSNCSRKAVCQNEIVTEMVKKYAN